MPAKGRRRPPASGPGECRPDAYLSPQTIADRLGLAKVDRVLSWIHSGELVALNVSARPGRPTWRVAAADLDRFLAGRRTRPATPRARRRERYTDVIRFY
jgi:hypothetical protein